MLVNIIILYVICHLCNMLLGKKKKIEKKNRILGKNKKLFSDKLTVDDGLNKDRSEKEDNLKHFFKQKQEKETLT